MQLLDATPKEAKAFWKSKRFWTTVVTAVAPLIPPIGAWAAVNPEAYSAILATLFGYVGVATKGPVTIKGK